MIGFSISSTAVPQDVEILTRTWVALLLKVHPAVLRVNGRLLLVGDGIKVAKSGRKMPAVKLLHQESESNTKPPYIMGHSLQAVAILAGALESVFAVPLTSRIHEGVVFSNRDKRTLLDKMVLLLGSLKISDPFYFIADAYYATRTVIKGLVVRDNHLISRVRSNGVAYRPAPQPSQGQAERSTQDIRREDQAPLPFSGNRRNGECSEPDLRRKRGSSPVPGPRPALAAGRHSCPVRDRHPSHQGSRHSSSAPTWGCLLWRLSGSTDYGSRSRSLSSRLSIPSAPTRTTSGCRR